MNSETKKYLIKRLYDDAFNQDLKWNEWFFEKAYRDEEAMLLSDGDFPLCCMMLSRYDFTFHGQSVNFTYINGATTNFKVRGKGYMRQLMTNALNRLYEQGVAIAGLIPANRRLFFFYDTFNFSTVVFSDIERYTSIHTFQTNENYIVSDPDYNSFTFLENLRQTGVRHSSEDFENILHDIEHDNGCVVLLKSKNNEPLAMVFATPSESEIHVKEVLGNNAEAIDMALGIIKKRLNKNFPFIVWRYPSLNKSSLRERGMLRIINVETILSCLVKRYHHINQTIKVSDKIIPNNNGTFILCNGICRREDTYPGNLNLDVSIDVLTKILFSDERIGNIFDLKSNYAAMSLMLD